jgi:RNA polymerase sigma-70 factor (ECF subfamily)
VDEVLADSFPASDPPSWNPGIVRLAPVIDRDAVPSPDAAGVRAAVKIDASGPAAVEGAEPGDEEVVRQVLAGKTALFELLMRRYNERLYRVARAIVRDEHEAEDVMQQAYVNAYAHMRQFNGTARFSTWLTRIAVNESLARVRRRGRYEPFDDDAGDGLRGARGDLSRNPERQASNGELRGLLERAIDTLPNGMREVFVLREVEGLSTSDVAKSLHVSEDVVKTRLSRGRAALRTVLQERTGGTAREAFRFLRPRCDRVVAAVLGRVAGTACVS